MKPSPARGSWPRKAKPKKLRPRRAKAGIFFSRAFLEWCQYHRFKPEGVAPYLLHTMALQLGKRPVVVQDSEPINEADLYDLPNGGKEGR